MTVGALHGELSSAFQTRLEQAHAETRYRLTPEGDMDAWLKCHLAFILPAAYDCYSVNCQLPRATKQQLWDEEFEMLRKKADMPMPTWDRLREQGRPVTGAHF